MPPAPQPRYYLEFIPDGPSPGFYEASIWMGNRMIQCKDAEGTQYVFLAPSGTTAGGWYQLKTARAPALD